MSQCLLSAMESVLDIEDTDEPVFTICDGICADIKTPMSPCLLSVMESVLI